jgi:hypothetical protein
MRYHAGAWERVMSNIRFKIFPRPSYVIKHIEHALTYSKLL